MSSVPPQLRGTRWWISRPWRRSQPGKRQCPSRSSTARVIFAEISGAASTDGEQDAVVVDEDRFDRRVGAELFDHRVREWDPGDGRRALRGTSTTSTAFGARVGVCSVQRARRRVGVVGWWRRLRLLVRRQSSRSESAARCSKLSQVPPGGGFICSTIALMTCFELGAHQIGQRTTHVEHRMRWVPPQLQCPGVLARAAIPRPSASPGCAPWLVADRRATCSRPVRPIRRRCVSSASCHDRDELLLGELARVRRGRDLGQRLQRPGGLDHLPGGARRDPVGGEGLGGAAPFVEDPQHRELLGVEPGVAPGPPPRGGLRSQQVSRHRSSST